MRTVLILFFVCMLTSVAGSLSAHAQCQCVCRQTPFGRECRRVCHYSPPTYYAPSRYYATPVEYTSRIRVPDFDSTVPLVIVGAGALLGVLFIVARALVSGAEDGIARMYRETGAMHERAREYESATKDINEHIAAQERAAFAQGQHDADDEWRRMTGE